MTDLTLEQWKERALVAEALLEERTAELQSVKADLEDARAKLEDKNPAIKPGDTYTIAGDTYTIAKKAMYKALYEDRRIIHRHMLDGPQWTEPERDQYAPEADVHFDELEREVWMKPVRDQFLEEFKQYAPEARVAVDIHFDELEREVKVLIKVTGHKERCFSLSRQEYEHYKSRPMGLMNVANLVSESVAGHFSLSARDKSELASRLLDALGTMERGKRERR